MKVQVFQLFFKSPDGIEFTPVDSDLYALAAEYAAKNLEKPIRFTDYKNTWVACEVNEQGYPIRALGILCMVFRADFPVVRFTDNAACLKLVERASDYLHDLGCRGAEVTVFISDKERPEQRCPDWEKWLAAFGMKPAERYLFTIK